MRPSRLSSPAAAGIVVLITVGLAGQAPVLNTFPVGGPLRLISGDLPDPAIYKGRYILYDMCHGVWLPHPPTMTFQQFAAAGQVRPCEPRGNPKNVGGGQAAPYVFSVRLGDYLPDGLTLDPASGIIYGTPTGKIPARMPTICVNQLNPSIGGPLIAGDVNCKPGRYVKDPTVQVAKRGRSTGKKILETYAIASGAGAAIALAAASKSSAQGSGGGTTSSGSGGSGNGGSGVVTLAGSPVLNCTASSGLCTGTILLNIPFTITTGTMNIQTTPSLFVGTNTVTPGTKPATAVSFAVRKGFISCYPTQTGIQVWDGFVTSTPSFPSAPVTIPVACSTASTAPSSR